MFVFLKPKTKFNKFGWTAKTCKNVILYIIRFTAMQYIKLCTIAKQTVYYCSASESLSLWFKEKCLIITSLISLSTLWSVFQNFSSSFMTCDIKLSQLFGEIFVLQTSQIKFNTLNGWLL